MSTLHDTDTALWAEEQAHLLRRRAELANNDELDWLHLAEEIEGVVTSEKRELRSRLALIIQHLLKWQYRWLCARAVGKRRCIFSAVTFSLCWQTVLHCGRSRPASWPLPSCMAGMMPSRKPDCSTYRSIARGR